MANTFRAAMRAGAMTLFEGYKAANPNALKQMYRGRPSSIFAPCGYLEGFTESDINYTAQMVQRTPILEARIIHGTFDSADAVDQQDAFADGFLQYVISNKHAAGAPTLVAVVSMVDDPGWVPEWLPPDVQRPYNTTVIGLQGSALNADY
jgi:hypothetical protein